MKIKSIKVILFMIIFSVLSGCSTYNPVNLQKKYCTKEQLLRFPAGDIRG